MFITSYTLNFVHLISKVFNHPTYIEFIANPQRIRKLYKHYVGLKLIKKNIKAYRFIFGYCKPCNFFHRSV